MRFEEAMLVFWGSAPMGTPTPKGAPRRRSARWLPPISPGDPLYRQPPDAVHRLLFPPLAALARRRASQSTIDRYLDLEKHPSAERGSVASQST
jgi:hypothetical protein